MKNALKIQTRENLASSMAASRKAHFAAGGTPTMWRGRASRFRDRKHVDNKNACRSFRGVD